MRKCSRREREPSLRLKRVMLGFSSVTGIRALVRVTGTPQGLARCLVPGWRAPILRSPANTAQVCPAQVRMVSSGTNPGISDESVVSSVERKLTEALKPESLSVIPAYGDPNGSHVSINVVSDAFEGLNIVKRHKLVYKAIWEELQGPIHAVDELTTRTPAEWKQS
jgi:stress-induced morphogen